MIINGERELAYLVTVTDVKPMDAERLECVQIHGWNCVCGKGDFHKGDLAIFFEIDSQLPEEPPYTTMEFLKSKHYKIKSQKIRGVISQGLLLNLTVYGETCLKLDEAGVPSFYYEGKYYHEGDPLTQILKIKYSNIEDNKRKARVDPEAKYKSMASRHQGLAKTCWWKWLYKKPLGKKFLFVFFGKKKDKNEFAFPKQFQFVQKTDEERVENIPQVLEDKSPLIVTEKLDGTSCTYILEKKLFGRYEFYVTSRNVRQLTPNQKTYHDDNIYWNLAFKYDIENKLKEYLKANSSLRYVCIQGEGVGGVQGNPLRLKEDELFVFNFIRSDVGRLDSLTARHIVEDMGMSFVPILDINYILPDNLEEFKKYADGKSVLNPEVGREGLVLRNPKTNFSFKNVSREYLLKN